MGMRFNRRQILVDRRLQLGHAALIAASQCASMLLIALAVSWFYLVVLDRRLVVSHNASLLWHTLCAVTIITLLAALWSIFFTHRIAGPARKLEHILARAAGGDIPPGGVRFRRGDTLKASETALNALLERHRRELGKRAAIEALLRRAQGEGLSAREVVLELERIMISENIEREMPCGER